MSGILTFHCEWHIHLFPVGEDCAAFGYLLAWEVVATISDVDFTIGQVGMKELSRHLVLAVG